MMSNIKIVSSSTNHYLANKISEHLQLENCEMLNNKEQAVEIGESCRGKDVKIVVAEPGEISENMMKLLIMINACKIACARSITVVIPYFPFSHETKKQRSAFSVNAKLMAQLIIAAGADRMLTMDLQAPNPLRIYDNPVDIEPAIIKWIKEVVPEWQSSVIVSPDANGLERTDSIAASLNVDIAWYEPMRVYKGGVKTDNIIGTVSGKVAIVVTDWADTSKTICAVAEKVIQCGAVKVYAFCVCGIFTDESLDLLNSSKIEVVAVTNTITEDEQMNKCAKIQVVDISDVLADAIRAQ